MIESGPGPLVSVIIPTFNRAIFIREAIDSVLAQSYRNLEVVVVDDGSTDDTGQIVTSYPDRVKYVRQRNAGPSAARNNGIRSASGSLLALLDSDDLWLPGKLEAQVRMFAEDPELGLCYGWASFFDDATGITTSEYTPPTDMDVHDLTAFRLVPTQSLLFSRQAAEEAGCFDESLPAAEDWDFCIRVAARRRIAGVPAIVARVRHHGTGRQGGNADRVFRCSMRVVEKSEKLHRDCEPCRKALAAARAQLRENYYDGIKERVRNSYAQRKYGAAIVNSLLAFWHNPRAMVRIFRRTALGVESPQ